MKYFKKLIGERIYLSPRNNEDIEQFTEWLMILKQQIILEEAHT